jgi:chorismate synthase
MLRFLTAGESHGPSLVATLDSFPAGLCLNLDAINDELAKRQQGYGRGARQKIETDKASFIGGVRHARTTGGPIAMLIENKDFANWQYVMSIAEVNVLSTEAQTQFEKKKIERFRPGHADLAGTLKFQQTDIRDVLERASARETAARVAVGAVCQQLLAQFGIQLSAHVIQVGKVKADSWRGSLDELESKITSSELFCADTTAQDKMIEVIKEAWQEGNSLGGVVEVLCDGLPVGLGSYTQWDRKLDGLIAQAVMSIQAMKAVELGDGIEAAASYGFQVHDALYPRQNGTPEEMPFNRKTNRAGGLEGGMTNGERLVVRAFMKPIPTMRKGIESLSFPEFQADVAHYERSDVCSISAASIVVKAMISFVLAQALLDKFGHDNLADIKKNFDNYTQYCRELGK